MGGSQSVHAIALVIGWPYLGSASFFHWRNDARLLIGVRLLVVEELQNLDVSFATYLVASNELVLCQPRQHRLNVEAIAVWECLSFDA